MSVISRVVLLRPNPPPTAYSSQSIQGDPFSKVNQITPPLCSKPRDSLIQLEVLQGPRPQSTLLTLAPCSFSDPPGHLLFPLWCSSPRCWHSFCSHLIQVLYSDISVTTLTTLFQIPAILLFPPAYFPFKLFITICYTGYYTNVFVVCLPQQGLISMRSIVNCCLFVPDI